MIDDVVAACARKCVLCWLATSDALGQPNVSPKEVFAPYDSRRIVVANIASPVTARNIEANPKVCISFVDIFVQKGFKLVGVARNIAPSAPEFPAFAAPLEAKTQGLFTIRSVFVIEVQAVEPILAPSYWRFPERTTESSQVGAAMRAYGVKPLE